MRSKKFVNKPFITDMSFGEYFEIVFDKVRHDWQKMPEQKPLIHKFGMGHKARHA